MRGHALKCVDSATPFATTESCHIEKPLKEEVLEKRLDDCEKTMYSLTPFVS